MFFNQDGFHRQNKSFFLVLDSSRYRDFEVRHQFMFQIKQRDDAVYMADLKLCLRDLKLQFVNQVSDLESSQK